MGFRRGRHLQADGHRLSPGATRPINKKESEETAELPVAVDGETIVLTTSKTDHQYIRLDNVDGARLDGTYVLSEYLGKLQEITFTADGRFRDEGAVAILEHNTYKTDGIGQKPREGTDEIKNYTLLLRYSDGREFTAAFLGLGYKKTKTKPAAINLTYSHDELKRR